MRVLIVGAGPTGLTAAVELARRGIHAEVIDRRQDGSTFSRAVGILPRSLTLLAPSGVTEKLLAQGVKIREVRFFMGTDCLLSIPLAGAGRHTDFVLALAQDRTEDAIRDVFTAQGGTVRYGIELVGLRQEENRVVVETADGTEASFDHVIGADGNRSATRQALKLDFPGHDLPETWSIADVDAENWPNAGVFTMCLLPGGKVAVVAPLEATRYRVISNTENALATLPLDLNVTHIRREGKFNISIRQVDKYAKGRVFLAGDAAHCHSPVGGRGMNLGIADAAELAEHMAEGTLEGYSAARHKDGAQTIALSERGRRLVTSSHPLNRPLLTVALKLIARVPVLQRRIAGAFVPD